MIKGIFIDCDGVLTTGTYLYSSEGKVMKEFSSRDSKGIKQALEKGIFVKVISEDITGSEITKKRCNDMHIDLFIAKNPEDKLRIAEKICEENKVTLKECAFIADDIGDMALLTKIGLPVAVSGAVDQIKKFALENGGFVTQQEGGKGAVREAIEIILSQRKQLYLRLESGKD
jgi:YrbI family 3-deoxy-D-manno-octulosonate 8-phosphate phosphatase